MGETIRKGAAVEDILADGKTTLTKAQARGGDWQTSAEARLAPTLALATSIDARILAATAAAAPALAALEAGNHSADDLLGRISDDVWNAIGRPASDVAYDILFPGGFAYYAEGDVAEQPDRMDMLAELLLSSVHPRLAAERAAALAVELNASSLALRALVDAARPLRARVELANKMKTAVAHAAQIALSNLKRAWKADGKSEADIHSVIPDRPRPRKTAAPGTPLIGSPAAPAST